MNFTESERAALADLLHRVGPDHPTLCGDWTTKDLAVHLLVREHRPDAAAGMFVGALGGHLATVSAEYAVLPYDEIVDRWAAGAPRWNPFSFADRWLNAAENFVHHEDVRRAEGEWTVRPMSPGGVRSLWKVLQMLAPRMLSKSTATVVLQRPDGAAITRWTAASRVLPWSPYGARSASSCCGSTAATQRRSRLTAMPPPSVAPRCSAFARDHGVAFAAASPWGMTASPATRELQM